jgi:hypothetical protein
MKKITRENVNNAAFVGFAGSAFTTAVSVLLDKVNPVMGKVAKVAAGATLGTGIGYIATSDNVANLVTKAEDNMKSFDNIDDEDVDFDDVTVIEDEPEKEAEPEKVEEAEKEVEPEAEPEKAEEAETEVEDSINVTDAIKEGVDEAIEEADKPAKKAKKSKKKAAKKASKKDDAAE